MKKPRPIPPQDAPPGTILVGGPIPWFSIRVKIHADDLVPRDVTSLLGVAPTREQEKGKPFTTPIGKARIAQIGLWSLELNPSDTDEWDVSEAAIILLSRIPAGPEVWKKLGSRTRVVLSAGVTLESFNQGLTLSSDLMRLLADREIQFDLAIYAGDDELLNVEQQPL